MAGPAEHRELRFRGDLGVAKAMSVFELAPRGVALYSNGLVLGVELEA